MWERASKFIFILHFRLFGLQNFCRDMNYYAGDTLNSLIRWAVYVYGFDFQDCIDTNYPDLIERLSVTDWEESPYPRRNIFEFNFIIETKKHFYEFSPCVCLSSLYTNCRFQNYFWLWINSFPFTVDRRIPLPILWRYFRREVRDLCYFYIDLSSFVKVKTLTNLSHESKFQNNFFSSKSSYNRSALLPAVQNLNTQFGGQEQVVPFVLFTNAGLDPWIGHGVSEYDQEDGGVIFLYCKCCNIELKKLKYFLFNFSIFFYQTPQLVKIFVPSPTKIQLNSAVLKSKSLIL